MKKLLFLLTISTVLFSCKVTWVPAKSAPQIVNVLDIQTSTTSLYDAIIASSDRRYVTYQSDYATIGRKIDTLVSVNLVRPHGANILQQSLLLQTYFYKYEGDHKARGILSVGDLRVYRDYLKSFIKPILISELSLK
ncbi:MAG TPA: hypothetical protein VIQ23_04195 [Hanamia sp.]